MSKKRGDRQAEMAARAERRAARSDRRKINAIAATELAKRIERVILSAKGQASKHAHAVGTPSERFRDDVLSLGYKSPDNSVTPPSQDDQA